MRKDDDERSNAAELHKPYRHPVTPTCKTPATLALKTKDGEIVAQPMKAFERRGLAVWYQEGAEPRSAPVRAGSGGNEGSGVPIEN